MLQIITIYVWSRDSRFGLRGVYDSVTNQLNSICISSLSQNIKHVTNNMSYSSYYVKWNCIHVTIRSIRYIRHWSINAISKWIRLYVTEIAQNLK